MTQMKTFILSDRRNLVSHEVHLIISPANMGGHLSRTRQGICVTRRVGVWYIWIMIDTVGARTTSIKLEGREWSTIAYDVCIRETAAIRKTIDRSGWWEAIRRGGAEGWRGDARREDGSDGGGSGRRGGGRSTWRLVGILEAAPVDKEDMISLRMP